MMNTKKLAITVLVILAITFVTYAGYFLWHSLIDSQNFVFDGVTKHTEAGDVVMIRSGFPGSKQPVLWQDGKYIYEYPSMEDAILVDMKSSSDHTIARNISCPLEVSRVVWTSPFKWHVETTPVVGALLTDIDGRQTLFVWEK
ncbi:MAG: hypothetical protein WCO23_00290 [bacterium]